MKINKIKNPWNVIASKYDEQFGDQGDYSHKYIIYPALINALGDISGKQILDLGCGTGTLSRILARKKAEVIGTDNASEMIKIAKAKKDGYKYPIEYIVADACKPFDFSPQTFDLILQVMILHSIPDENLSNIILETHRTLKDNGECYIVIPHPYFVKEFKSIGYPAGDLYLSNYKTFFIWKQFNEICKSPTEFYLRPFEFYSALFETHGFAIKQIYEPKVIDTEEAMNAKPNTFHRRREIPGFMMIKLVKLTL